MVPNNVIHGRIGAGVIILTAVMAADLHADEISLLKPPKMPGGNRTLSFPPGQCTGNLYLESESGPRWDPKCVTLSGEWEHLAAAQGEVLVPRDRNVRLLISLALGPQESARLLAQNPLSYRLTVTDRVRKDPDDLSGLLQLDPNDLFGLSVISPMYRRTGTYPGIFEPIRNLTGLQMLRLSNTGITDKGLENLRPLRSLRALELSEFSITSQGLMILRDLPALEYLDLDEFATDAGLKHVGQHANLRWLRIRTGRIWGPGLAELANMPRLERLCIWGTSPISDRHIKYLESLTHLKSLTLWGVADRLTDASLASIGKLKNLEELYFIRTGPRFSVAGMTHLRDLNKLRKIDFGQIWTSHEGMRHGDVLVRQLAENLPNLESIEGLSYLSAEGMRALTTFQNLKCLHVALKDRKQGYYGPTGLRYLAGLSSLEELHFTGGKSLSDADLAFLEPLSNLKDLHILSQDVTDRGLASIGKLKQLERLDLSCPVSPSSLNQLNGLSNLQYLKVSPHGNAGLTGPADELTLDLSGLKNMKDMNLFGLPLRDSDLTFLKDLPSLEKLMIQPVSTLSGSSLRHFRELPELNRLFISQISDCTAEDMSNLNGLAKLRDLTVIGDINDTALSSLKDISSLWSLSVDTDEPIRRQTVTDLTRSNPSIEYIHINEKMRIPTAPPQRPESKRAGRPRIIRRAPRRRR